MHKKNKTFNLGCQKKIKKTYNLGCRQKKEVVKIPKKKKQISNDTFTYIIYTKADSKKVKKKKKIKKMNIVIWIGILFIIAAVPVRMRVTNGAKTLSTLPNSSNHSVFHQVHVPPASLHPILTSQGRNDNVTDYDEEEGDDGERTKRKLMTENVTINQPKMVDVGERCNDCVNKYCKIGLICTPTTGICVGPAKKGGNCSADASGYMCESGSWCNEDFECIGEVGKDKPCTEDYECQGGMGCNLGKCTRWYSVTKNNPAESYDFCEVGLGFDTVNQQCLPLNELECTEVHDCTVEGFGVTDSIFYTCNSKTHRCEYNGPYCWYFLEAISQKSKYNNYYDKSKPRVPINVWEDYATCV